MKRAALKRTPNRMAWFCREVKGQCRKKKQACPRYGTMQTL